MRITQNPLESLLLVLACTVMALGTSCTCVKPNFPQVLSVTGHGAYDHVQTFSFFDPVKSGNTITRHTQATLRIQVPWPTTLELAITPNFLIDAAPQPVPLTKVDPAMMSDRFTYTGEIENPGGNPAIWVIGIREPSGSDLYGSSGHPAGFLLTIVDSCGSEHKEDFVRFIYLNSGGSPGGGPVPVWRSKAGGSPPPVHKKDPPAGPCPGGGQEQTFNICFTNPPNLSQQVSVSACTYADAVAQFSNQFSGWSHQQGSCPP